MKTINKVGAQGDVMFIRAAEMPEGLQQQPPTNGQHIVAHSETGHHHYLEADGRVEFFYQDPFTCYLRVTGDFADVVHARPFDTHETVRLGEGTWQVRRQREHVPGGYRRVED